MINKFLSNLPLSIKSPYEEQVLAYLINCDGDSGILLQM